MVKYIVLIAVISAGISGVWFHGFSQGEKTNQLKNEKQINLLNAQIVRDDRAKQKAVDDVLQSQGVRIADINRQHVIDIARLRDRPERVRESAVVSPGTNCSGGTGINLSRPDAEFLVGEATRADTIQAGLIACYAAYDALD